MSDSKPVVGYSAQIHHSICDTYGNVYWAMEVCRVSDGATARGRVTGGESNCTYALRKLAEKTGQRTAYGVAAHPIRAYDRMVKEWPYLGCTEEEIIAKLESQFAESVAPTPQEPAVVRAVYPQSLKTARE